MTIPFSIPFGHRRLVLSLDLLPAAPDRVRRKVDVPAAYDATDAELARINARVAAAQDRVRWEAQAVYYGLRTR
jgi:hypothetical protein